MDPYHEDEDHEHPWSLEPGEDAGAWSPLDEANAAQTDDPLAGLAAAAQEATPAQPWHGRGPALDAAGRIDADLSCRGCGYNLRGQHTASTCPECGSSVAWSTQEDRLAYYDPDWLASLKRGTLWFIIAIFAAIALSMVNGAVSAIVQPVGQSPFAPTPSGSPPNFQQAMQAQMGGTVGIAAGLVVALVSAALYLIGVWQVTAPMPDEAGGAGQGSRLCFRWGWVSSSVLSITGQAALLVNLWVGFTLAGLSIIPMFFSTYGMLIYYRALALRVPDKTLAKQTRAITWGITAMLVLFPVTVVLAMVIAMVGGGGQGTGLAVGLLTCGGICGGFLGLIGLAIWWVVLLFFYLGAFSKAEKYARDARRVAGNA